MRFTVTEDSLDKYEAFLNERSGAINDCIMFLHDACLGIQDSYKSQSPGDLAILMLVRHLIESIDGVCVLISKGSVQSCEPLLRSALDAFLGVNYILQADSDQRGLAYLVADRHRLINFFRQCDPDDERGKKIRKEIPDEFLNGILGQIPVDKVRETIAKLEEDLNDPDFKPIEEEYKRTKSGGKSGKNVNANTVCPTCGKSNSRPQKREPKWYSLFNGPKSIYELARHVNLISYYELMYRPWSDSGHAANTTRNVCDPQDSVLFRPIRHPDGLTAIPRYVALLTLPLAQLLIAKYSPERRKAALKRYQEIIDRIRIAETDRIVSWRTMAAARP